MDTTHTFHLPFGEMTISPRDFAYLTSIPCDGRLIEFDASLYQPTLQSEYIHRLLGFLPRVRAGTIPYGDLRRHWDGRNPTDSQEVDQLIRSFLLYMFGCTLFADAACNVDLCLLPPLRDLNSVRQWDWGSPSLAALYRGLDRCCRGNSYVQGYGFLVEVSLFAASCAFYGLQFPIYLSFYLFVAGLGL